MAIWFMTRFRHAQNVTFHATFFDPFFRWSQVAELFSRDVPKGKKDNYAAGFDRPLVGYEQVFIGVDGMWAVPARLSKSNSFAMRAFFAVNGFIVVAGCDAPAELQYFVQQGRATPVEYCYTDVTLALSMNAKTTPSESPQVV